MIKQITKNKSVENTNSELFTEICIKNAMCVLSWRWPFLLFQKSNLKIVFSNKKFRNNNFGEN